MNKLVLKPKRKHFLINVFCLVIGITSATLLFRWVLHEFSYYRFVEDGDRIYRLVSVDKATGTKYPGAVCQLREDLLAAVPQVEECVAAYSQYRTTQNPCTVREMERNESIEVKALTTSDNFFKVFTYPIVEGNPHHILQPNEVAISKEMAQKLYDGSALGKPLAYSYMGIETVYTVALVAEVPSNTHLPFEVVVPLSSGELNLYRNIIETQPIYVKLRENALFNKAEMKQLANIQEERYDRKAWLEFQPLYDIHLHTDFVDPASENNGNASYVWIIIFGILLIVAVTIVNCATLDVSYSVQQTKNRVVKRVFGCSEFRIFSGNILETLLITLVARVPVVDRRARAIAFRQMAALFLPCAFGAVALGIKPFRAILLAQRSLRRCAERQDAPLERHSDQQCEFDASGGSLFVSGGLHPGHLIATLVHAPFRQGG